MGTPYVGLLSQLGIWPVEKWIEYKRLMLFHQILRSKESRLLREIIINQIEETWTGCWTDQTKELCQKYSINIETIKSTNKNAFKRYIKDQIKEDLNKLVRTEAKSKTKMRFCTTFKKKQYVYESGYTMAKRILKLKLNMLELKCN